MTLHHTGPTREDTRTRPGLATTTPRSGSTAGTDACTNTGTGTGIGTRTGTVPATDGSPRTAGRGRTRRTRLRRAGLLAVGVTGVLVLAGCTQSDQSEIVTWTDEHGRACTGVAVVDSDDNDREVTSIDCDYPPEGKTPGRTTSTPLPRG